MQMRPILLVTIALFPDFAQSDGQKVTELVTRYSMIKICSIYEWVSTDPASETLLDALDLKIRAEKAKLDPATFSAALKSSRQIVNETTDTGRNSEAYASASCTSILHDEAAAFRAER